MSELGSVDDSGAETTLWADAWRAATAEVLSQVAGKVFQAKLVLASADVRLAVDDESMLLIGALQGALRGEFNLRLSRKDVQLLGQLLLGETMDAKGEFRADFKEAADELLRQVAGHVETKLSSVYGAVQLRLAVGPSPSWHSVQSHYIDVAYQDGEGVRLTLEMSAALIASVRTNAVPCGPSVESSHLGSFRNVRLAVTLRFGGRQMLLRDVLDLNTGAVVELDRKLEDPVDLLLDGKLIARGEVVVVDGNYGLRVTEVTGAGGTI